MIVVSHDARQAWATCGWICDFKSSNKVRGLGRERASKDWEGALLTLLCGRKSVVVQTVLFLLAFEGFFALESLNKGLYIGGYMLFILNLRYPTACDVSYANFLSRGSHALIFALSFINIYIGSTFFVSQKQELIFLVPVSIEVKQEPEEIWAAIRVCL